MNIIKLVKFNLILINFKYLTSDAANIFPYTIETAAQFDDHLCTVWRVAWNITGTVLASSGDDVCVRLWKCKFLVLLYLLWRFITSTIVI